jgi:hypothetical protein
MITRSTKNELKEAIKGKIHISEQRQIKYRTTPLDRSASKLVEKIGELEEECMTILRSFADEKSPDLGALRNLCADVDQLSAKYQTLA